MPDLNSLLAGVDYVVVGGTATSLYMPLRTTKDVDVLVARRDETKVEAVLRQIGASFLGRLTISRTSWKLPGGEVLDVLSSDASWVDEAMRQPNRDAAGLPIIPLPYLVLLKLEASRAIDIGDLSRMLGGADDAALAEVRRVVRIFLPEAAEDMESLIHLGCLEYAAPENLPRDPPTEDP
jgi:hypothetical protein